MIDCALIALAVGNDARLELMLQQSSNDFGKKGLGVEALEVSIDNVLGTSQLVAVARVVYSPNIWLKNGFCKRSFLVILRLELPINNI